MTSEPFLWREEVVKRKRNERIWRRGVDDAEWREASRGEGRLSVKSVGVTDFTLATVDSLCEKQTSASDELRLVVVARHVNFHRGEGLGYIIGLVTW